MNNLQQYNAIFVEVFGVDTTFLNDSFSKDTVHNWDSVHQLNVIALMEEKFDLLLDPEDIMACTSYEEGKKILQKYNISL